MYNIHVAIDPSEKLGRFTEFSPYFETSFVYFTPYSGGRGKLQRLVAAGYCGLRCSVPGCPAATSLWHLALHWSANVS